MHATDPRHPYEPLTPDLVQGALASLGLWGDGRLSALSSYENRVYQAALEVPLDGPAQVVLKFYPARAAGARRRSSKSTPSRPNWPPPMCRWWRRWSLKAARCTATAASCSA